MLLGADVSFEPPATYESHEAFVTYLRAIALTSDNHSIWRQTEESARERANRPWSSAGDVIPGVDGIRALPLDCLAPLQRQPEVTPIPVAILADCVTKALAQLECTWPEAAGEVRYFVRAIIAGHMPRGRQSSGSSEQFPFVIRVDFCPDDPIPMLADALVHEAAHVKLRLSGIVSTLCAADETPRFHHPWRPEPRPLAAVLVASHAFVAVHGFHARLSLAAERDHAVSAEHTLRGEVKQVLRTLAMGFGLTPLGQAFTALLQEGFEANYGLADAKYSAATSS
jgi:HEXXH motif-containing protein